MELKGRKGIPTISWVTILFSVLFVLPFLPLILSSIAPGWKWPELVPQSYTLRAWKYIFGETGGTWEALGTSIWIAGIVSLVNLILAIPAAYTLARHQIKGKWLIEGILYAPIIVPPYVAILGMHRTFIRTGLTDSLTGVIIAHLVPTLPYMIRALVISFSTLDGQMEDQAKVLGASRLQRFRFVVFPHILPGIVAGTSLSVLISLSQYVITLIVGGGQVSTLPILMFPFISGGDFSIGSGYALLFACFAASFLLIMDLLLKRFYGKRIQLHLKT